MRLQPTEFAKLPDPQSLAGPQVQSGSNCTQFPHAELIALRLGLASDSAQRPDGAGVPGTAPDVSSGYFGVSFVMQV